MKDNVQHTERPPRFGGGPRGLGDPNDFSLRKVEKDVLIPQKMRDKAREHCHEEVAEFTKCCAENNVLMPFKCKQQNSALISCLEKWFTDEKFREECTQEYLEERRQYRLTGISKKSRQRHLSSF